MDELTASLNYLKLNFIDYIGQDKQGQHIFAIYACRLPNRQELNEKCFIRFVLNPKQTTSCFLVQKKTTNSELYAFPIAYFTI